MLKREQLAQRASPAIGTLIYYYYYQTARFLRRAFLDMSLPLGVEAQNEKEYLAFFTAIFLLS